MQQHKHRSRRQNHLLSCVSVSHVCAYGKAFKLCCNTEGNRRYPALFSLPFFLIWTFLIAISFGEKKLILIHLPDILLRSRIIY